MRAALVLWLALLLGACSSAHYRINPPLTQSRVHDGYTSRNLAAPGNSDSLNLMIAFSGGGYRAAAMAQAALEVLRDTPIEWEGERRSMLQELDLISAVSGGSLAAAFYGRDPTRFFSDFGPQVLDFDLQAALIARSLSPQGLWRQGSPTFGRGDLLQELLDEQVFNGMDFGAMPRRRPMVMVHATDMRSGDRFEFTQDQFDHLCADLDRVPLARAVAASMAVPVLLSPITLWNHRSDCPLVDRPEPLPVAGRAAQSRYIHLVDGGLADNTGLRAPLENVALRGGLARTTRLAGFRGVRTRVFVLVNAQAPPHHAEDDSPHTPGLWRQLRSAIDVPIDRQSDSSVQAFGEAMRRWQADADDGHGAFHLIEISVATAHDRQAADALREIPTGLRITAEQVAAVRRFVRGEFAAHAGWQRLVQSLRPRETTLALH